MDTKTKAFIHKANLKHNSKYAYTKTKYIKSSEKITITCPEHGDFEQRVSSHLNGRGCNECGILEAANKHTRTTEQFIEEAIKIHGFKYGYDKTIYNKYNKKVIISCSEHGEFEQTPADHLQGCGCQTCAISNSPQMKPKLLIKFIEESLSIHGNFYTYNKVHYLGSNKKVIITCPIHGDWEQTPSNHIRGNGCPKCSKSGFNPNKPAILYYLKITTDTDKVFYKVGITNRTVNERFSLTELKKIEIIKQRIYDNGQDALTKEREILQKYKEYKYHGPKILESGNTELFIRDIRNV